MADKSKQPINDKEAKLLWKFSIGFLAVSCLVMLLNLPATIKDRFSPPRPFEIAQRLENSEKYIRQIRIGEQVLNIPIVYFFTTPSKGVDQDAAHLMVLFPNFEPLTEKTEELWDKNEPSKTISVLVSDATKQITKSEFAKWMREFTRASEHIDDRYGLAHYSRPGKPSSRGELFILGDFASPETLINCNPEVDDPALRPQCTHYFTIENITIKLGYSRALLPSWRTIEENISSILKSFFSEEKK